MTEVTVYEDGRCGVETTYMDFGFLQRTPEISGIWPLRTTKSPKHVGFPVWRSKFHDYGRMILPAWAWEDRDD